MMSFKLYDGETLGISGRVAVENQPWEMPFYN
jgi:hypothetical protein